MIDEVNTNPFIHGLVEQWAASVMAARGPNEIVRRHGSPFFERWMIARKAFVPTFVATKSGDTTELDNPAPIASELENLFLHRFLRDDFEDFHDHPWPNTSYVVSGAYLEDTPDQGAMTRKAGSVVIREAHEMHRILSVVPGTVSLFVTGQKIREWGFWPEVDGVRQFVHHAEYTAWRAARESA